MLLQRLNEYAQTIADFPPALYQHVPIRYVIRLDAQTQQAHLIDTATEDSRRGKKRLAPDYSSRTSKDCPLLFADHAEYTLAIPRPKSNPEKALRRHLAYRQLVATCAKETGDPTVRLISTFLDALEPGHPPFPLPKDFSAAERITFCVIQTDGKRIWPIDLPSMQQFWALTMSRGDTAHVMHCLVCGKLRPPVETLPTQIRGVPGDQVTIALFSANDPAFESYGLERSRIAPLCDICAHTVCTALNTLLSQRETHVRGQSLVYIFWATNAPSLPFGSLILQPDPTEVHTFLTSPWRGRQQGIEKALFYAAAFSSNTARLVVRDWLETTLEHAVDNLQRYFRLQRIVNRAGSPGWFPLWQLVKAALRPESRDKAASCVEAALLHFALHGGSLPEWLLAQTMQCIRAEQLRSEHKEQGMHPAHAALLKLIVLSQSDRSWLGPIESAPESEEHLLVDLDGHCTDRAYLCGRLFAVLEEIETLAMGSISNDIVGGYFNSASSTPAVVFASLLRRAHPHLATLGKTNQGAASRLKNQLLDIFELLQEKEFPTMLSALEQGRFGIGYYQQKAASRRAAIQGAQQKQAAKTQPESSAPDRPTEQAGGAAQ